MRYQQAKKVTLVSAFFNACLAMCKLLVGFFSNSHGIFADGLHSLSDLLTDFLVIVASKYGSQAADDEHPYGHQRIETAATFFLSLLLVVTGSAIIFDSISQLFVEKFITDGNSALVIIGLSLFINEALYHYTLYHGKRLGSKLLIANAWHHRSDSLSSFVVLLGVIGNLCGFYYFDSIAASLVGLLIIKMGWSLGWNSMKELIDTSIKPDEVEKIRSAIINTPGVIAVHQLRTRSMAGMVLVDVHVLVETELTVSEGHYIGQHVAINIRSTLESVDDVTVHIDPEDDEIVNPSIDLPCRENVLAQVFEYWLGLLQKEDVTSIDLHYLDGSIKMECFICDGVKLDVERARSMALTHPNIKEVIFYQSF